MRRDNRGISRIVEFVIMFTVFLVIVTSFYSLVNIWTRPPIVNYNQEEAMRVSEVLIGNPGCMDNNNSKTNWEEYPAYYKDAPNIDTNMTALGLAKDKNSYGVLSMSKILGMGKITYSKAKEMLALSPGQNFNISFQIIGNETKIYWGADYTNAKNVGMYKRIVAVYNPINNSYVPARLAICLFDGSVYNEKIVINEIMYAPPNVPEGDNEWIELYNPTSMAINVSGWFINDSVSSLVKLQGWDDVDVGLRGAVIPANGFAVFPWHSKKSVYENFTFNPDAVWLRYEGLPPSTLNNNTDIITLRNRYYDIVDLVTYHGVNEANNTNESLERKSPWDEILKVSNTSGKGGTLGRRNTNSVLGNLISVGPDRCNVSCFAGKNASFNITVMNNGNINDTITISNISELGWNVSIVWLSGGTANWTKPDGTIGVNLSAINRTTNIFHIYAKLRVNVTVPVGADPGDQNICVVIANSTNSIDTASILTRVL